MSIDTKYRTKEELRQRLEQLWKEAQLRQAERLRKQQAEGTIKPTESRDDHSVDIGKAKRVWKEYQETHDVSHLIGKVVGIDPITERVWFGNSLLDVVAQRDADGIDSLLLFERVGYRYCFIKC